MTAAQTTRALLFVVAMGVALVVPLSAAAERSVAELIRSFDSGSVDQRKQVCEALQWRGLSDTKLFDKLEARLLEMYQTANVRATVDEAGWMARGLAFSGLEKYRASIGEVARSAPNRKLRSHATKALRELDTHKRWNPIIGDTSQRIPELSARENRYANMVRSGDPDLMRIASKRVYHEGISSPPLLRLIEEQLKERYLETLRDRDAIDVVAWLAKALAYSGGAAFRPTVEEVARSAGTRKVRAYAQKYLRATGG